MFLLGGLLVPLQYLHIFKIAFTTCHGLHHFSFLSKCAKRTGREIGDKQGELGHVSSSSFMQASGWPTAIFLVLLALAFWKTCSWLSKEVSKLQRLKKMVPAADLHHYNINQFFSYRADYYLSTQSYAKPLALGAFTLIIISIGGFLKCGLTGITLGSSFWDSWIYVVDTSAHADEETTTERVSALLSTVGGMFIFATMIGYGSIEGHTRGLSRALCELIYSTSRWPEGLISLGG